MDSTKLFKSPSMGPLVLIRRPNQMDVKTTSTKPSVEISTSSLSSEILEDRETGQPLEKLTPRATKFVVLRVVRRRGQVVSVSSLQKKRAKKGIVGPPPIIEVTPRLRQTFRFFVNGTLANTVITYADIFGALGGICTVANTTLKAWTTSFKIVSIDMYLPASGVGEIEWISANADQSPDFAYSAELPTGITTNDKVHARPPPESTAGDWINAGIAAGTDTLFQVSSTSTGAVLDLDVEYTLPNAFSTTAIVIAAGVLGTAYYLALDQAGGKVILQKTLPSTA